MRKPRRTRPVSSRGLRVLPALGLLLPSLLLTSPARSSPPADEPPHFVLGASLSALEPLEERDLREAELLYAFLTAGFR